MEKTTKEFYKYNFGHFPTCFYHVSSYIPEVEVIMINLQGTKSVITCF